jgi:drug/metabolite transporter (DMT)-like permease
METSNKKWIFLAILSLIWGSSFILIKKGLLGLSPMQVGSLRIIFAGTFLLIIGFKSLIKIPSYKWKYIVLTAMFGTFIPAFLFAIAQTQIDSSISSILNSLTPMNTLLIGILAFGLQLKRTQIIGVFVGLLGSALLILNGAITHPNQNYYYAILVLIASLCYATNVNLIKKHLSDISPLSLSAGNFAVMLVPSVAILYFTRISDTIHLEITQTAILYVLILGVIGTGIANIIFFKLIQISSPVFATSVTYLIPVVAFFWGIQDHENINFIQIIGAIIILIGVYLASKKG